MAQKGIEQETQMNYKSRTSILECLHVQTIRTSRFPCLLHSDGISNINNIEQWHIISNTIVVNFVFVHISITPIIHRVIKVVEMVFPHRCDLNIANSTPNISRMTGCFIVAESIDTVPKFARVFVSQVRCTCIRSHLVFVFSCNIAVPF